MILRWFVTIVPCFAFVPKEPTSYAEVQFFILALLLDRNSSKCCQFVCVCACVIVCVSAAQTGSILASCKYWFSLGFPTKKAIIPVVTGILCEGVDLSSTVLQQKFPVEKR